MKKLEARKLTLGKQVVRALVANELHAAVGGLRDTLEQCNPLSKYASWCCG